MNKNSSLIWLYAILSFLILIGCPLLQKKIESGTEESLPSSKEITSYSIVTPIAHGVISSTSSPRTISVTIPAGTNSTALVAAFTTTGVSVKVGNVPQVSGVTVNNFINPVDYSVTAQDGSTAIYRVTVSLSSQSSKAITSFSINGRAGTINEAAKTITVLLPYGTNLTSLTPTFATTGTSVTVAGQPQTNGATVLDFTNPVIYTVKALGNSTAQYTVTVPYPVLYISNNVENTVSVLNGLNGSLINTVYVGSSPAGIGVNPVTKKIYVANMNDASVSVINGTSNTVIATIPLTGLDPQMVGVNPVLNRIYVAYQYYADEVIVIDGATDSISGSLSPLSGNYPVGIGVNPTTDKVYIVLWGDSSVDVWSGTASSYLTNITNVYSNERGGIAVNPVTNKIYVPDVFAAVQVIDGVSYSVTNLIDLGAGTTPISVAVNTVTNRVYTANRDSDTVSVIDGTFNTVVTSIPVGDSPIGIAVSEKHNLVYVVNSESNSITVIDGATNTYLDTVSVGNTPLFIGLKE